MADAGHNATTSVMDDLNSLRFELEQYDPEFASQVEISDWDCSWGGMFALQELSAGLCWSDEWTHRIRDADVAE